MRLGRLPSRDAEPGAARREPAANTTSSPRRTCSQEDFRRVEALASRIGVSLDSRSRQLVRAIVEGSSLLWNERNIAARTTAAALTLGLLPHTSLVVAPEVLPLSDLRDQLRRAGVTAILMNEERGAEPSPATIDSLRSGSSKVVLATPRLLQRDSVLRALAEARIDHLLVLDAARASTWSPGFWPAMASVPGLLGRLGNPAVVAFASACTAEAKDDLLQSFGLEEAPGAPPFGQNVTLDVRFARGEGRVRGLVDRIRQSRRPTLVLCNGIRDVDAVYGALQSMNLPVHRLHADMRAGARAAELLEFSVPGDRRILVSTSAFAVAPYVLEEEPEGVVTRYGRRTSKADIRSLVRFGPPSSVEELAQELALLGRDGEPAEATVFYDSSDRPALEAELEASRPKGHEFQLFSRALEAAERKSSMTTEELALAARSSRRSIETVARILDGMGLVSHTDGWIRLLAHDSTVVREIRQLAERYAIVRSLDARRLGDVSELLGRVGCRTARLQSMLGVSGPAPCGRCEACQGAGKGVESDALERRAPARRFTVTPAEPTRDTFHSDRRTHGVLTAKMREFG